MHRRCCAAGSGRPRRLGHRVAQLRVPGCLLWLEELNGSNLRCKPRRVDLRGPTTVSGTYPGLRASTTKCASRAFIFSAPGYRRSGSARPAFMMALSMWRSIATPGSAWWSPTTSTVRRLRRRSPELAFSSPVPCLWSSPGVFFTAGGPLESRAGLSASGSRNPRPWPGCERLSR